MLMGNTEVSWYGYANVESSDDYIRAKSMYYNELSFSDMSINMSGEEIEDYNTDMHGRMFWQDICLFNKTLH